MVPQVRDVVVPLGLRAEDYESDRVEIEELYQGFREIAVDKAWIDAYYSSGDGVLPQDADDPYPNEYLVLKDAGTQASALGKYDVARKKVRAIPGVQAAGIADMLPLGRNRSWGVAAKGQVYAIGEYPSAASANFAHRWRIRGSRNRRAWYINTR